MADRRLERTFQEAFAQHEAQQSSLDAQRNKKQRHAESEEARLRKLDTPMAAKDAIRRILLAWKDKDYFRCLSLPPPEADELGRPVWDLTAGDVSKAYRRLSILVHPDKNPGDEAREAFEALNHAHRLLRDPGQLEEILRAAAERAVQRKEHAEASATLEERVALNSAKNEKLRELTKSQGDSFQAEILRQQQLKLERARKRKAAKSQYRRDEDDEDDVSDAAQNGGSTGAGGEEHGRVAGQPAAAASRHRKGKPRLIF